MTEFFGSPDQQTLLRRGLALYDLIGDHPATTYYGRGVGVVWDHPEALGLVPNLVTVLGVSNVTGVPDDEIPENKARFEADGYAVTHYVSWEGGDSALEAAERTIKDFPPPPDVEIHLIDETSPHAHLEALADVSIGAGVLPIAGPVLRGVRRQAMGAVAIDADGRGVSCAAASYFAHPDAPNYGPAAWWGMLATRSDRKGQRLALILGAMVLRHMNLRYGTSRVFTGVQPGNAPSEAVCSRMGLSPSGRSTLTLVDPDVVAGGRLTK